MAAVSPPADQATELLQKLSLDAPAKTHDTTQEGTKKPSTAQFGSVNSGEAPSVLNPTFDRSLTPILPDFIDPNMYAYTPATYYYGSYDGSLGEWDDYRYLNQDGVEMSAGVYGDIYQHGYGYAPYGAYTSPASPVPTLGHDGQLYGQHYQYSAPYYQPPAHTNAAYASSQPPSSQVEVPASAAAEKPPLSVDAAKANSNGNATGNNSSAPLRTGHQSSSLNSSASYNRGTLPNGLASSGYQDYGFDGARSPIPWYDGSMFSAGQYRPSTAGSLSSTISYNSITPSARNQNNRPISNLMGLHNPRATAGMGPAAPGYLNRMYPNNRMYGQYGNTLRSGLGFGTTGFDSRTSGRWGLMVDSKFKPRGRGNGFFGYGNENLDGFGELNRGPRAGRFKNPKAIGPTVTIAVKGQNLASTGKEDSTAATPDKEQYNRPDFPENYSDAKFFIIKSYSEDDIHKSIKYSVWASTPNGNRKLDAGYKEAQEKAGGCPVFLFFSVNTSGQFVGVAEMVSPVDFDKSVDYWQQDKWTGCFSVKWHIVKDVPNNILKHIILENNDNKPVTNSRDTQEVKLEQGLQMIKLFKEHVSKTSILDDFAFYENRQKMMQEKKAKQQQTQKQASNVKTTDAIGDEKEKNGANVKLQPQTSLEPISILNRETAAKVGKEVNRETVAQVGNGVNRETAAQIGNGESQETAAQVGNAESKETAAQAGNGENIPSEENVSDPSKAGNGAGNSC